MLVSSFIAWLPAAVLVLFFAALVVALVVFLKRNHGAQQYLDMEATQRAALDLRGIQHKLEVARMRGEVKRDADSLRDELEEALYDKKGAR